MFRRALLASVFALPYILPAFAQNETVPTRPPGDSTNAAASTAFVNQAITGSITGTIIQNLPVIGGPNNTLTQGTRSGTTTLFMNGTGSFTNGDCLSINGGNIIDANTPCNGSVSGTITAGAANQFGYYPSNGTTIAGLPASNALMGPNQFNVVSEGADPTGGSDSTAVFNAVLATIQSGGQMYVPCGTYKLTAGSMTPTIAAGVSMRIIGGGRDCTFFNFGNVTASAVGLDIGFAAFDSTLYMYGITFLSAGTNANTIGLRMTAGFSNSNPALSSQSTLMNMSFRGADGYAVTDLWAYGIYNKTISNVQYIDDTFVSPIANGNNVYSVWITGDPTNMACAGGVGCFNVANNFTNCNFYGGAAGIGYGPTVQGVAVTNTNFDNAGSGYGIVVPAGEGPALVGLTVTNSQFGRVAIVANTQLSSVLLQGNIFIVSDTAPGILAVDGFFSSSSFTSNSFQGAVGPPTAAGSAGIVLSTGSENVVITGNNFALVDNAIVLFSGTANNNVQSNSYGAFVNHKATNGGGASCPPGGGNCLGGGSI